MKHFIIIDMQNDFCTGSLANPDAVAIIPRIKEELQKAKDNKYNIIFTKDTHYDNYLETGEGKYLPVKHCIAGTPGHDIVPELDTSYPSIIICKDHFGYSHWDSYIKPSDEVIMCGTCTDICVVSNALAIKAIENVDVTILSDCCAGLSKEKHEAALEVMRSCQCKVI